MSYNIFSNTAPAMPKPEKGTEIVKLILFQASRDSANRLFPMAIPALAAHLSGVEFMYYFCTSFALITKRTNLLSVIVGR